MLDNTGLGWKGTVQIPTPIPAKPRRSGLTMVIDKGLGPAAMADLLAMGAHHVDLLKLGFGTSLLYPPGILEDKIALAHRYGVAVYPGGTLLELAELQGQADAWLDRACRLGFNVVEVSDGTIRLSARRRRELIQAAASRGLKVISEIGKKVRGSRADVLLVREQVAADVEAGAQWVIIEGRDSGEGVGIYDEGGRPDSALVEGIVTSLADPNVLIWEAPRVSQQQSLILQIGPQVNLGNIQPSDITALAATRAGLRGDTFRLYVERIAEER